jgi:hypothetical protein
LGLLLNVCGAHYRSRWAMLLAALQLDPNYSQAYAGLGWAYMFDYQNRWSANSDNSRSRVLSGLKKQ